MGRIYIETPYSDSNPAPATHDPEGCIEWCAHCALCGVAVLYGARCTEHHGVYPLSDKPETEPCPTCGWTGPTVQFLGIERREIRHPEGEHEVGWQYALLDEEKR